MNERTHKFKRQHSDVNAYIKQFINKLDNNKKIYNWCKISNKINNVYIKELINKFKNNKE